MAAKSRRAPNNMGSLYERSDGRWEGRVSLSNGKRKSVYANSEKECVARMQELLNDVRVGVPLRSGRDQKLQLYLNDWLGTTVRVSRTRHLREL